MKIKSLISAIFVVFIAVSFASCSSAQKGGDSKARDRSFVMDQANQALSDISYSPYGKGWVYKNTIVPSGDFTNWSSKFKNQITQAIDSVGDGFLLQVTGHTCSIGPRDAEPSNNKKGNIWYSEERAKAVHASLIKEGIPADKMIFKGVADDEPLAGKSPKDQLNRRVTFKIVEDTGSGN